MWYDEKGKKSRLPAPQYCDFAMTFIQRTVNDENIFPTKYANEFPRDFETHVRKILRLLFHVIAHVYFAHFREIALLGLHSHLNSTFALLTALNRYVVYAIDNVTIYLLIIFLDFLTFNFKTLQFD